MINYNKKRFILLESSSSGDLEKGTTFMYMQEGDLLTCEYSHENVRKGQILGKVDADGCLDFNYRQTDLEGKIRSGHCKSRPYLKGGVLYLKEEWRWDDSGESGTSLLKEIK